MTTEPAGQVPFIVKDCTMLTIGTSSRAQTLKELRDPLQGIDYHTGFLVSTPEGAALRIRDRLHDRYKRAEMGQKARDFVRDNFLITRPLRDYLTVILGLMHGTEARIDLG